MEMPPPVPVHQLLWKNCLQSVHMRLAGCLGSVEKTTESRDILVLGALVSCFRLLLNLIN